MNCLANLSAVALAFLLLPAGALADHVLGYQFEEGSGTFTADSESTVFGDQFGTLENGATFSPGISLLSPGGFALELDGVNDSVLIANAGSLLQGVSAATISAFVNIDAFPVGSFDSVVFLSNALSTNQARLTLQIGENGSFALGGRRVDENGFARYTSSTGLLSLNTTHHIAATVDFSSGSPNVHLYLDGTEVTVTGGNFSSGGTAFSNTEGLVGRIGAQGGGGAEFVDGTVDDVRIWRRELSAAEIATQAVPEPGSILLLGLAGVGLCAGRRRRV